MSKGKKDGKEKKGNKDKTKSSRSRLLRTSSKRLRMPQSQKSR